MPPIFRQFLSLVRAFHIPSLLRALLLRPSVMNCNLGRLYCAIFSFSFRLIWEIGKKREVAIYRKVFTASGSDVCKFIFYLMIKKALCN